MALYTILFGLSIFMIAMVIAMIKKMFFKWKEEHKIERMTVATVERPAVGVIIYTEKCLIRRKQFEQDKFVYDIISKSDISLPKTLELTSQSID